MLASCMVAQFAHDRVMRTRMAIGAHSRHGVVSICHGDNARYDGDPFTGQPIWISCTVDTFMMLTHSSRNIAIVVEFCRQYDSFASLGVGPHQDPFLIG